MNKSDEIVIFENPQKGMAAHPLLGIGLLRQIDIDTYPGLARLNKATSNQTTATFTVTIASPAIFTKISHGLVAGNIVTFTTTGALPTGLTAGTTYYVIAAGLTADAFEVSTSFGGSAVNTTGSQSGVHSFTIIGGLVYWIIKDPKNGAGQNLYALDSNGIVFTSTNGGLAWSILAGNTLPGAASGGQGLAIWKDYLFVARATALDLYGPLSSSPAWRNSWAGLTLTTPQDFHTMLPSVDDKLYICNQKCVAKVIEVTTFVWNDTNSYTASATSITLPQNYNAKCLADLGANLMVGTWFGTGGFSGSVNQKVADIFPYIRSTLTLGIPIKLGENGVHAMITVGNRLYAIAGLNAKIFLTDGASSVQVGEIPNYNINILDSGIRLDVWPGAICYHRKKILFGIDNSAAVNGNVGVWSFNSANKQLMLENIVSSGGDGSSAELAIGALFSNSNESYLIGWKDSNATVAGIDTKSASSFVLSYGGVIETFLPQIGQFLGNRTIQSLEFYLTKPLITGQGIRFKYRTNLTSSFATLATRDFATNGALQSDNISAATITNAIFLQFRIELTSTGNDTPELVRVALKPSA